MTTNLLGNCYADNEAGNSAAQTQCAQLLFSSEEELEARIKAASDLMCEALERSEKLRHWREMVRLMDQRTPHYVRYLERRRGLR